jgi:hypothetical protein
LQVKENVYTSPVSFVQDQQCFNHSQLIMEIILKQ